ncbi:hypothetical protein [Streptomyces sp. NPDC051162]|uniref:hypothetical protein n=1 Tax=Streptomyces sp. NPDC051162 TaxID=3154747 RepID=UPI003414D7E1
MHGDLTGNVLFAAGLAPGVIDFSPYWRPPAFAGAVVVADALTWHHADETLLHEIAPTSGPDFAQYVARALIFRLITTNERLRTQGGEASPALTDEIRRYRHAQAIVRDFTTRHGTTAGR